MLKNTILTNCEHEESPPAKDNEPAPFVIPVDNEPLASAAWTIRDWSPATLFAGKEREEPGRAEAIANGHAFAITGEKPRAILCGPWRVFLLATPFVHLGDGTHLTRIIHGPGCAVTVRAIEAQRASEAKCRYFSRLRFGLTLAVNNPG